MSTWWHLTAAVGATLVLVGVLTHSRVALLAGMACNVAHVWRYLSRMGGAS